MAELVTKQDLLPTRQELEVRLRGIESHVDARIENLELRLMVRLGVMLPVAVAILAAIIKF